MVFIGQVSGEDSIKAAKKALRDTYVFINFNIAMFKDDKNKIQKISLLESSKLLSQTKAGYGYLLSKK